jgi:hypothetical protein
MGRYDYIKKNLRDMYTKPWKLLAETDMAWVQHASHALYDTAIFTYETAQTRSRREAKAKEASDRAERTYEKRHQSGTIPSNIAVRGELKKFGAEYFLLEAKACKLLEAYALEFLNLEFMAKTQHGQTAFHMTANLLKELGNAAEDAYKEYERCVDQLTGVPDQDACHRVDFINGTAFLAKYKGREDEVATQIVRAAAACADAIEFEAIKSYVVTVLEKDPDNPDKWIARAQKLETGTAGGFASASSAIPGQGGTIAQAVSAFVTSGTTVVDKIVTSARRSRRVEKIRKDPAKMGAFVRAMHDNPLMMAEYLSDKYMSNLKHNLTLADPLVFGTGVALDIGGHGVPIGKILAIMWDSVKVAVKEIAKDVQDERIRLARAELKGIASQEQAAEKAVSAWEKAQELLEQPILERLATIFDTEIQISDFVDDPSSVFDISVIRRTFIKKVTQLLMSRVLARVEIPPAQLFDVEEFFNLVFHFDSIGDHMQAMGFGGVPSQAS